MSIRSIIYHHRQFQPWWSLMIIVPVLLLIIVFYMAIAWIVILIGLVGAALFWGLTVEVNKDVVRLYFGFGIIHRSILREHIAMVTQVRNRWWWGFGIRWIGLTATNALRSCGAGLGSSVRTSCAWIAASALPAFRRLGSTASGFDVCQDQNNMDNE